MEIFRIILTQDSLRMSRGKFILHNWMRNWSNLLQYPTFTKVHLCRIKIRWKTRLKCNIISRVAVLLMCDSVLHICELRYVPKPVVLNYTSRRLNNYRITVTLECHNMRTEFAHLESKLENLEYCVEVSAVNRFGFVVRWCNQEFLGL